MKIIYILLLLSVALNAQVKDDSYQQIYGLLLEEHLNNTEVSFEQNSDYEEILKALENLDLKGIINAKEKRGIEKILGVQKKKDTLVFCTDYAPEVSILKELREMGVITVKEKRKIKRALMTGYLIPNNELNGYFDSIRKISPVSKDEYYTKRYFSRPINLNKDKKAIFSETTLINKKHNGEKAMGCATITIFSKEGENWLIEDVVCYETY